MTAPVPQQDRQPAQESTAQESTAQESTLAAAMARLEGVHELPLHEQPDLYQAVHSELQHALAAIDSA